MNGLNQRRCGVSSDFRNAFIRKVPGAYSYVIVHFLLISSTIDENRHTRKNRGQKITISMVEWGKVGKTVKMSEISADVACQNGAFLTIFALVVVDVNCRLWDLWRHIANKFLFEEE